MMLSGFRVKFCPRLVWAPLPSKVTVISFYYFCSQDFSALLALAQAQEIQCRYNFLLNLTAMSLDTHKPRFKNMIDDLGVFN